jgi:phosphoglycerate kinase
MASIHTFDFSGKRALVRVDFNVPVDKTTFHITDDTRIRAALPTLKHILKSGGSIVLMSHFGRPKNGPEDAFSLKHLLAHTSELLGSTVLFGGDCIGEEAFRMSTNLKAGEVLMLENVRFYKEETAGETEFAKKLAQHGDVYVNDAFGTAHRAHASTAIIAGFFDQEHKLFGMLMEEEVKSAQKVLSNAEKPFTAIIGGAKVSDKILIIENLLDKATDIIIGGGMAYTFWKAQGKQIGNSLCEDDRLALALTLLEKAAQKGVRIHLPVDSTIADQFSADAQTENCLSGTIPSGWMGLDIGTQARKDFHQVIAKSKTILWNGPMGVFEMEKFQSGTKTIAEAVVEATENGAFSLVGGGDSVAAVNKFGFQDQVSYVSTGGGAMLEFFEGKTLPGIQAIQGSNSH